MIGRVRHPSAEVGVGVEPLSELPEVVDVVTVSDSGVVEVFVFDALDAGRGAVGCREDAAVVVDHPKRGEIVVCDGHARNYRVVRLA